MKTRTGAQAFCKHPDTYLWVGVALVKGVDNAHLVDSAWF